MLSVKKRVEVKAIILKLNVSLLEGHYICPDPFYSCPASGENEVESSTNGCDCGKDKRDLETKEIIERLKKLTK